MPKKTKKHISNLDKIHLLYVFISICVIGCIIDIYTKYFLNKNISNNNTEVTCIDVFNNIAYLFATHDKQLMTDIKYHMSGLNIPCMPSNKSKIQLEDQSRIAFALYNTIDNINVENNVSLEELIYNKQPLGAFLAIKTYFIRDNYYQVKFLDRYIPMVIHLSCQYEKFRFDCVSKDYKPIDFDCPKTEQLARQKLSAICEISPTNYLK